MKCAQPDHDQAQSPDFIEYERKYIKRLIPDKLKYAKVLHMVKRESVEINSGVEINSEVGRKIHNEIKTCIEENVKCEENGETRKLYPISNLDRNKPVKVNNNKV